MSAFHERWLSERRAQWSAVRWRTIDQVTPLDCCACSCVVRSGVDGHYLTFSKSAARIQSDALAFSGGRTRSRLASDAQSAAALAPVPSGSGVIEKDIEVTIGRRFKRQGRSWRCAGPSISFSSSRFTTINPIGTTGEPKALYPNQNKPRLAFIPSTAQLTN